MLGTFQKDFSHEATSQGYFPKCAISKAATSQVCPSRRDRPPLPVLAAALGDLDDPSRRAQPPLRRLRGPNLAFGKLPLGKLHI